MKWPIQMENEQYKIKLYRSGMKTNAELQCVYWHFLNGARTATNSEMQYSWNTAVRIQEPYALRTETNQPS